MQITEEEVGPEDHSAHPDKAAPITATAIVITIIITTKAATSICT